MKKSKPPVLVILCMFLLLLLIVVPPIFRKYIPKENQQINNKVNTIQILSCNKTFSDNIHKGSSTSKYINDEIITNTINFTIINNPTTNNTPYQNNNQSSSDTTYEQEYQKLTTLKDINIKVNDNVTNMVIDKKIYNKNKNNENIDNYYNPIEIQKENYELLGYKCQIIEG